MNEPARRKIIAAMPAYNEGNYIGSLIVQARQYVDEVIVIDDGSTDHTARVARLTGALVVQHKQNMGYGCAIQSIFTEAKKRNPDILIIFDADSQHNPDEMTSLIKAIADGSDVVIGSREMQTNKIAGYRRLGQRILSRLTQVASRKALTDTESGFRAYSSKAINMLELKEKGMAISSEIVTEAVAKGLKVTEVPISVTYTSDGSTLNPVSHGFGVLNRIMAMISERRPLLFFSIFGGIFLAAGIAACILVIRSFYYATGELATGTALLATLFITIGIFTIYTGIILNVMVKRIRDKI